MDDLAACIDLCESHGFSAPAAALRALAEGKAPFYLARSRMSPEDAVFWNFDPAVACPPGRQVFRDRVVANQHARALTIAALRTLRIDLRSSQHLPYIHPPKSPTGSRGEPFVHQVRGAITAAYHRLKSAAPGPPVGPGGRFAHRVGVIFGTAYKLPAAGALAFPAAATDEQLGRIGELLDFTLFDVVEIGSPPTP